MTLHALDVVVLNEDLPAHGLQRGDLSTVGAMPNLATLIQ